MQAEQHTNMWWEGLQSGSSCKLPQWLIGRSFAFLLSLQHTAHHRQHCLRYCRPFSKEEREELAKAKRARQNDGTRKGYSTTWGVWEVRTALWFS